MLKRLLPILLVTALLNLALAPMAFASFGPGTEQTDQYVRTELDDTTPDQAQIDINVFGYVGEDVEITDDKPDDPDQPPSYYVINVAVPTKILWAAFEGDLGDVSSPDYCIKNLSTTIDLKVTLTDFVPDAGNPDNVTVDPDLSLNLVPAKLSDFDGAVVPLWDGAAGGGINSGSTPLVTTHLVTAHLEKSTASIVSKWDFTFGGNYGGSYPTTENYKPTYKMSFLFEIV